MAEFGNQGAENAPLRAPWFDEGEEIVLRPALTYFMVTGARARAQQIAMDAAGVTPAELASMDAADVQERLEPHWDDTLAEKLTMLAMIESWTLRDATGVIVPLDLEHVALLSPRTGQLVRTEMERRSGAVAVPQTEGGDFRRATQDGDEGTLPAPGEPGSSGDHSGGGDHRENGLDLPRVGRRAHRPADAKAGGVERPGRGAGGPQGALLAPARVE